MKRILEFIKAHLYIIRLENKQTNLQSRVDRLEYELRAQKDMLKSVMDDNSLVLSHVSFLNSHFKVAADVSVSKYEPTIICILRRGAEQVVDTYCFNDRTMMEIHRILEGFGQSNVRVDQPISMRSPRFRY